VIGITLELTAVKTETMETYTLEVVVEPDEDRWHAYCPALQDQGAATWGHTRDEALRNIEEVVQLVIESMVANRETLPAGIPDAARVTVELRVAINV
jgi:predicted RNase H-like HicB family nuclease